MVDLLIPGPSGKIEAKYNHNNNNVIMALFKIKDINKTHKQIT